MDESLFYFLRISGDNAKWYDLTPDIASVTWAQRLNEPDLLTITVPDPFKVMTHALREGMVIEYELGTDTDHPLVFRGLVYTIESSFPSAGVPMITLLAYDGMKELGMHIRNASLKADDADDVSIADAVKSILNAKRYKFDSTTIDLTATFTVRETQMLRTDLQYLKDLCHDYECVMFVDPNKQSGDFTFTDAGTLMKYPAKVTLSYGRSGVTDPMIEFHATVDAESLSVPTAVTGMEWLTGKPLDRVTKKPDPAVLAAEDLYLSENLAAIEDSTKRAAINELINANVAAVDKVKELRLSGTEEEEAGDPNCMFTSISEMQHRADNWLSIHAQGMSAEGRTGGTPRLRAATTVQIQDVGGRFSGTWFLTEVTHTLGRGGYHTNFRCRR